MVVLCESWDVLCIVEHKDHHNTILVGCSMYIMLCWQVFEGIIQGS